MFTYIISLKEKYIFEIKIFLLFLLVILTQSSLVYSITLYLFLFFCIFLFWCYTRKNVSSLKQNFLHPGVLLLLVFSAQLYNRVHIQEELETVILNRNLPDEAEIFIGEVFDDTKDRTPGLSSFFISGKFSFYDRTLKIRVVLPDVPWRPEAHITRGSVVRCHIPLPQEFDRSFSGRLRSIKNEINLASYVQSSRLKEYYCIPLKTIHKELLAERMYAKLLDEEKPRDKRLSISERGLGLLLAASLGRGEHIESWIKDGFKETGLYHLLVVSGYHLGVVLIIGYSLVRCLLRYFPNILGNTSHTVLATLISWVFAFFFLHLSRVDPPLLRAAIMMCVFTIAKVCERDSNTTRSMLYSLIVLHLVWPLCIFTPGVQLSYCALIGVFSGLRIASWITKKRNKAPTLPGFEDSFTLRENTWTDSFIQVVSASLGASLMTMPVQWYWFSTLSPYSVIFNILFGSIFSIYAVLIGMTLIFLYALSVPGIEYLIALHTHGVELLVILIDDLYRRLN